MGNWSSFKDGIEYEDIRKFFLNKCKELGLKSKYRNGEITFEDVDSYDYFMGDFSDDGVLSIYYPFTLKKEYFMSNFEDYDEFLAQFVDVYDSAMIEKRLCKTESKKSARKSLTEKELKMDVWEWGDVKGTDEELCNHIAEYAEEKGIEYMEITEDEFEYLKKDYLKKYKSMKEGIQKKDWESWKIDSIGGTVFEYYFNGYNEKENVIQSLIEDDYPTIKVDYGEILGALNKEFRGKTLGDMQKKGYILPWGKDIDLGIHFDYEIEKLNSVSNGNSGMVELHCDFYIPSTDEIYNFGCHAFVYVDDLDVSMFLESKKSAKKSLKEGIDETLIGESKDGQFSLYLSDQRRANHGKDPHYEIILATNGYFTKYVRTDDKKAERVVSDWITLYDIDLKGVKFSELFESKKSAKKSMKESFDDDDLLVIDVIDMMILNFEYDKKTVEKYFYKIHKLNDFDTISLDEYIKIKEEIEKALGYDIFQ